MPVQKNIPFDCGVFSITITCAKWLPLIEITDGYDLVYDWFSLLEGRKHHILGYVIMPNHLHAMIAFHQTDQSINTIVGNGKRFIAYEVIKRLKQKEMHKVLDELRKDVEAVRKLKNKQHDVWELSFDWKYCTTMSFIWQKLQYYHQNPCRAKWRLAANPVGYKHSSASYYATGKHSAYSVTNFNELNDINFID